MLNILLVKVCLCLSRSGNSGSSSIGIDDAYDAIIKLDVTVLVPSRVVAVWGPAMLGGAVKFTEKFPC